MSNRVGDISTFSLAGAQAATATTLANCGAATVAASYSGNCPTDPGTGTTDGGEWKPRPADIPDYAGNGLSTPNDSTGVGCASADGGSIVYISSTGDDRRGLFLMAPDGSDQHGLAHSKHQDFCFPSWSPDGRTIVFSALNRLGSQGIMPGEEKPRCEQWSGEYQMFAMDAEGKIHMLSDARVMGTRPSYGRLLTSP